MHNNGGHRRVRSGEWANAIDKLLIRGIALLVVLLILSQFLLQFPAFRHRLTTSGPAEGVPYTYIPHRH